MRVITGLARGKRLKTVEGLSVRPTAERVKEAVFSSIQFEVPGATVLDLFCGSGQMGIEALSREARFCVFVDSGRESQAVTRENLMHTGLYKQARVVAMEADAFLATTKDTFDIAFLDPPYSCQHLQRILPKLAEKMSEGGIILAEHEGSDEPPTEAGDFILVKRYRYGRVHVSAYRHRTYQEG